ncbi:MAG: 1-deoxy-D-xylulose-5-phosphate reductoisomerase, partial [Lachnospiraceae bacterium]|nr:1-deoxy-D-xylulose-5-phosphate reductoisomerase [Lachnospiraceae bacterium]
MIRLVILGSTGSIGSQALDIVRANRDRIEVAALAAGKNAAQMERDIREFMPKAVCLYDEEAARNLRLSISDLDVRVLCGIEGLKEIAAMPEADLVLSAIVGMIGIEPTLAAIKARRKVALANKESLVAAGHIIMKAAEENGVQILPVDSEHSAIFQSLQGAFESGSPESRVEKILLTASGGPFRGLKPADLNEITAEAALKHPNWSMGPKVTIDSSTLANKGLEVMEAHWLFNVPYEKIEVLIHPESIVHSGVQFIDGAVIC